MRFIICDRLRINRPLAANIEFTLREFKVKWSLRELRLRALLLTLVTTERVGLPLCNVRFLYAYFQAIVHQRTEPEILRVQNLCPLYVPRVIEIKLRIVRIQKLITLHWKFRLKK